MFKIINKITDIHQRLGIYFLNEMKFLELKSTITNIKNVKYRFNRLEKGEQSISGFFCGFKKYM